MFLASGVSLELLEVTMKKRMESKQPVGFLVEMDESTRMGQIYMFGHGIIRPPDMVLNEIERIWLNPKSIQLSSVEKLLVVTSQKPETTIYLNDSVQLISEVSKFRVNIEEIKVGQKLSLDSFVGIDKVDLSFISMDAGFLILMKAKEIYHIFLDFIPNAYELTDQELEERRAMNEKLVANFLSIVLCGANDSAVKEEILNDGWFYGYSIPLSLYKEIIRLYEEGDKIKAESRVREFFSPEILLSMLNRWNNNNDYEKVFPILCEGIHNYIDGRYASTCSTLLPLLDGITARKLNISGYRIKPVEEFMKTNLKFVNVTCEEFWENFKSFIDEYLFRDFRWGQQEVFFGRHSALHGAITDYNWKYALQTIIALNDLYFFLTYFPEDKRE